MGGRPRTNMPRQMWLVVIEWSLYTSYWLTFVSRWSPRTIVLVNKSKNVELEPCANRRGVLASPLCHLRFIGWNYGRKIERALGTILNKCQFSKLGNEAKKKMYNSIYISDELVWEKHNWFFFFCKRYNFIVLQIMHIVLLSN